MQRMYASVDAGKQRCRENISFMQRPDDYVHGRTGGPGHQSSGNCNESVSCEKQRHGFSSGCSPWQTFYSKNEG